jgi:hypothetical protein
MDTVKYDPALPTLPAGQRQVPSKAMQVAHKYRDKLRLEVFTHYCGGKEPYCQCPGCRVTYIGFLQLDHVNGDGMAHRKKHNLGTGADRLWRWVRDNGYPPEFQVLCCNCNHSKFNGPACALARQPHCSHFKETTNEHKTKSGNI